MWTTAAVVAVLLVVGFICIVSGVGIEDIPRYGVWEKKDGKAK